jgi:hypothetical protein
MRVQEYLVVARYSKLHAAAAPRTAHTGVEDAYCTEVPDHAEC